MNGQWRTVFRSLVAGEWALNLLIVGGSVPPELQDIANQAYAKDPKPFQLFLAIACSLGLMKIIAEIGLFFFKGWARPMFAILAIFGIVAPFAAMVLPPELAGIPDGPL